ncbi:MAG: 23S rRNA (uracil(1939)-C(5))-methyltransferase RlmD [Oscillospiraceae bacterium]|nr:23S rRNA (uracil(1939)-C(5))-methyltransferase RlmD [Oscillospiraceae bacterium]
MTKNQVFTAEITGCTSQGFGVARFEDRAVFIKGAIPGETCEIKLVKITKTAVYGRLERVLIPSPHRTEPVCPHFGKCGGCDFMHMDYQLESELKRQRVYDALSRIGGVDPGPLPISAAPTDTGYRNKAQFPVALANGTAAAGFFRARTHDLIPVTHCHIQPEEADRAAAAVLRWMEQYHILPYDEETHRGYVRHIFVRKAVVTGQLMVCIIANAEKLPKSKQLVAVLQEALPELTTVVHNVNTRPGNAILGPVYHNLFGDGYIEDVLCGLTFRLSPASFYQVNHDQAQLLYEKAISFADLHGTETVLDLYCGTGTITLALSRKAGQVIGVEVVPQAIEDAKENARRNGIENAEFFCADAGPAAEALAARGIHPDVISIDPPRKGITPQVIDAMVQMAPERIVYVSCDPATLARDVKLLEEKGYRYVKGEAVDLFPRTKHVETVCLMSRKEK